MRRLYENCTLRNKETRVIEMQGLNSKVDSVNNYINTFAPLQTHKRAQLLFNSLGYSSDRANLYHIILELSKLSILTTKNLNSFFIGEGELGKSFLLLNILDLYSYKVSGELGVVALRGNKTASDQEKVIPLLEKLFLILEEQMKNLDGDVISLLKDSLESGYFKNNREKITKVLANFILVGNTSNKIIIKDMKHINFHNILVDFNKAWTSDKQAMQRIDAIFPHFGDLSGSYKGEKNFYDGEVISTIDLKDSLSLFKDLEINIPEKFFLGLGSREQLSIKKIATSLIKILFPDSLIHLEDYQYSGVIEIAKHFHWMGNSEKEAYSPFNQKSLKFLCSLVTSIDNLEFSQILANRLIIKKIGEPFIRKYALNGFGIRENEKEADFSKTSDILFPVIDIKNKGWLLTQNFNAKLKYKPFDALYFNNHQKPNLIKEAEDNETILKLYELSVGTNKISYLDNIEFKGIPYHVEFNIKKELEKENLNVNNMQNIRNYIAYGLNGEFKLVNIPNI